MGWMIDTSLPYGNACDTAVMERDDHIDVTFSADPHGGMEALWFCLRVRASAEASGKPLRLVLKNPQNTLAGPSRANFRPVIRADDGDWQRLPAGVDEALPDGRVQVGWIVPRPLHTLDVALCYPYGQPEIDRLRADTGGLWQQDTIGVTQRGRPITRLSNRYGTPGSAQPGLYLIARQHSGETSGSWVLDGFMRHIALHPEHAPLIWCVPLANRDGVEEGDYGKDPHPIDVYNAWQRPVHQTLRYEIQCIQRDLALWAGRCTPLLGLDFHAPGGTEASGIYAYTLHEFHFKRGYQEGKLWSDRFGAALAGVYAAPEFTRYTTAANYFSRWGTPEVSDRFSEYMWNQHGIPALILEVPYALCGDAVMTRELYQDAGARMAQALLDALR